AELTAEKFLPDPFSSTPGGRMYRTGDLGRYRADGNIEYIGRIDQQIKVRGYRIELGEIEAALREHPAVAEAAVTARADTPGERRLVGYLVLKEGAEATTGDLRKYIAEKLPDYMVPTAYVMLDK